MTERPEPSFAATTVPVPRAGPVRGDVLDRLIVKPAGEVRLEDRPTRDPAGVQADKHIGKHELLPASRDEIKDLQRRLYAEGKRSVLLVLQGTDTSGKDGTIRHVLTGITPAGIQVTAFSAPSSNELAHDYLWRIHAACPERGRIGVFNRSHYEDVVTARVRGLVDADTWRRRHRHINEFERMLVDEGTTIVKCFLHLSRDEQRRRLQARLDKPHKRWKFSQDDVDDRARWSEYQAAYADTLRETSTPWAPWYVVPADRKWQRNLVVAELLVAGLRAMDPQVPDGPAQAADIVIPE